MHLLRNWQVDLLQMPCRFTVTYPRKHKRLRAAFPRSSLREGHATIGTNEGLAIGNNLHIASSATRTWSCSPTALLRALVVGSSRNNQTALRAKQPAFGVHQPTRVASRWLTALVLVAPSSLSDVSRREEGGPLEATYLPPCSHTDGRSAAQPVGNFVTNASLARSEVVSKALGVVG
jgi:hypothetical protein